jgi:toxin ParE1/3/4
MSRVRFAVDARRDLDEIWEYSAEHGGVDAAERFANAIEKRCRLLATAPEAGRRRDELGPGLRSFPVGPYVIFYRRAKRGIEIARVLRGARDIAELF